MFQYHCNFLKVDGLPISQSEQIQPIITIQSFKKDGDPLALTKTLQQLQPHAVVMYDADLSAVRQLEVSESHCTFMKEIEIRTDMINYFLGLSKFSTKR